MSIEAFLPWLILIVGGYLLGSVMFCRLICLVFYKTDICKVSSDGNPGAANAFRCCGKVAGASGLLLDMLKGFLPVFIAMKYLDYNNFLFALVMFAPVFGHAFSIFHGFSGGKCISTIYGELAALLLAWTMPTLFFVLAIANLIFEYILKPTSGYFRAFVMFSLLILAVIPIGVYGDKLAIMVGTIAVSVLAIVKHLPLYETTGRPKKASLSK
ncbi:glycerol-3-phosphate acyltransferase [Candidatus Saccharibacteria bacterium]|nr:glycerol-3-phosphate acyltransferase [Candidatus Saccharibacteria bacterium]